jgi:putative transposase
MVSETTPRILTKGHTSTMALDQPALLKLLELLKAADVDERIRWPRRRSTQRPFGSLALIDAELTAVIGVHPHQRTEARTGCATGGRARTISTTARDLELKIPRLRAGSFFRLCSSAAAGWTSRCSS